MGSGLGTGLGLGDGEGDGVRGDALADGEGRGDGEAPGDPRSNTPWRAATIPPPATARITSTVANGNGDRTACLPRRGPIGRIIPRDQAWPGGPVAQTGPLEAG